MKVLVTGSSGLIGSAVVEHFAALGWDVHGVDNNMRADFFGPAGDTRWNQHRLEEDYPNFRHHELDIRDRPGALALVATTSPQLIVHAAAQPSHDLAASRPFDDFDVNAVATMNLLEATRRHQRIAEFVDSVGRELAGGLGAVVVPAAVVGALSPRLVVGANLSVGQEVPPAFYQEVAVILAYVYRLSGRKAG
jgi:GDP-D-mannose dehydratase